MFPWQGICRCQRAAACLSSKLQNAKRRRVQLDGQRQGIPWGSKWLKAGLVDVRMLYLHEAPEIGDLEHFNVGVVRQACAKNSQVSPTTLRMFWVTVSRFLLSIRGLNMP